MMRTWTVSCTLLWLAASAAFAADLEFKLVTTKTIAAAHDLNLIRNELLLGSETIERILIADLLNDGFDENDVVQLYPSGRVLRLAPITARLDSLLRAFRLPPNVEIHETRQFYTRYDSLSRARRGAQALGYGILGGLAERLNRGYGGDFVEGYFKFSKTGNSVLAWNFDSTRVSFPLPEKPRVDTVHVYHSDTIYVPEIITVTPEPLVLRDTVYIPSDLLRNPRGVYYRFALGMFGGRYSMSQREVSRGRLALGAGNEWDFGVWDPWISGRQDIDSRIGMRFMAEMAPWKTDTLSPRFLATSLEAMFIPAWDRNFFLFTGVRAYFDDDLFWDRTRAAWDEDLYAEPSAQDLAQLELTIKAGLDKFAAYGSGKRFGAWIKLSGWFPGGEKSGYDLTILPARIAPLNLPEAPGGVRWRWEHSGGTDVELAGSFRIAESAQMVASVGQFSIANLSYDWSGIQDGGRPPGGRGLIGLQQLYQSAAVRIAPYNVNQTRALLEVSFRNNTLVDKIKQGDDETILAELFYPYFESPELAASLQVDVSIVRIFAGVRYYLPPDGLDAQLRPEGGLYLLFR